MLRHNDENHTAAERVCLRVGVQPLLQTPRTTHPVTYNTAYKPSAALVAVVIAEDVTGAKGRDRRRRARDSALLLASDAWSAGCFDCCWLLPWLAEP